MKPIAALFCRADSVYSTLPHVFAYDLARDARTWPGGSRVVCHPPCRLWGRLRTFVTAPEPGERELGPLAVELVRKHGGVLEHPELSTLWAHCDLPRPGTGQDAFGGFTIRVLQWWWGHRADKPTWLYICGISPDQLPAIPFREGPATHVIQSRKRSGYRPHVTKREREQTPKDFAVWLVELARLCKPNRQ